MAKDGIYIANGERGSRCTSCGAGASALGDDVALGVGHQVARLRKVGDLLGLELAVVE